MEWIPQSPDLNVIENIWVYLKDKVYEDVEVINNKELLKKRILKCWSQITKEQIQVLIATMPKRCRLVIKQKGFPIKY